MNSIFQFVLAVTGLAAVTVAAPSKMDYWSQQRKGANLFDHVEDVERLQAAKEAGIEFIRLAPNKWETSSRDFLIGDADNYSGIIQRDFAELKRILDQADSVGLKVVLTTLSLPGCRWKQQNGGKDDKRLWHEEKYRDQSARFWREVALRLRDHPAVVGYNILNEPHLPRESSKQKALVPSAGEIASQSVDLNTFNHEIIKAIREVDKLTPIVLDCDNYASPTAITEVHPMSDSNILYSLHMYEPWDYTTYRVNKKRFRYPGTVWDDSGDTLEWNQVALEKYLGPVEEWQSNFSVASKQIIVSEFGCDRRVAGAMEYLSNLIAIFDKHQWHWAFYSFREDTWDGMDYELGDKPLGAEYWNAVERGEHPAVRRTANPIFNVIRNGLNGNR